MAQSKQTAQHVSPNVIDNLSWRAPSRSNPTLVQLKSFSGIGSTNALAALLLSKVAAMTLVGFNAYQTRNGFTPPADHVLRNKPKQGPLWAQCLAQNTSIGLHLMATQKTHDPLALHHVEAKPPGLSPLPIPAYLLGLLPTGRGISGPSIASTAMGRHLRLLGLSRMLLDLHQASSQPLTQLA